MDPTLAMHQIRDHLFYHKFMEIGKILLTYSALAHSPTAIIPQRVIFIILHRQSPNHRPFICDHLNSHTNPYLDLIVK